MVKHIMRHLFTNGLKLKIQGILGVLAFLVKLPHLIK
jgi:hypothetical protein